MKLYTLFDHQKMIFAFVYLCQDFTARFIAKKKECGFCWGPDSVFENLDYCTGLVLSIFLSEEDSQLRLPRERW